MTEAKRRITITKRVSLADFGEGWSDCYAIVTPADRATYQKLADTDVSKMTQAEANIALMDVVKEHFVAGTIKVWDGQDQALLSKMLPDDIDSSLELANRLYIEIMGLKYDPKGSSGEAPNDEKPISSKSTTETSSSTESPTQSPQTFSETSSSSDTPSEEDSATAKS